MESRNNNDSTKAALETRWLKRILFPFWTCRCSLMVLMGVAYVTSIYGVSMDEDIRGGLLAATILIILLTVLCISLDLVSTILLSSQALKPSTFLAFQIIETAVWIVVLVLEIVSAFRTKNKNFLTLFISFVLFLSFLGLLTYASVIFHRNRQNSSKQRLDTESTHSLHEQSPTPNNPFNDTHAASFRPRSPSIRSHESDPPPPYSTRSSRVPIQPLNFVIITAPEGSPRSRESIAQHPNTFVINAPVEVRSEPRQCPNSFEITALPDENARLSPISHNPNLHRYA